MKSNNTRGYCSLFFLFFFILRGNAQDKRIFWVHGLNGAPDSWETYKVHFDQCRQAEGELMSYNQANGMDGAVSDVQDFFEDLTANDPPSTWENNIAIGHSQGNLVDRGIVKYCLMNNVPLRFGGFISIASSNYGAPILNSRTDGRFNSFQNDACHRLTAGPTSGFGGFVLDALLGLTGDKICGFAETGLDRFFAKFAASTSEDYKVGAPWITDLNQWDNDNNTPLPRIQITAQEDAPIHWRVVSSMITPPGSLPLDVMSDDIAIEWAVKGRAKYEKNRKTALTRAIAFAAMSWLNPVLNVSAAVKFNQAAKWKKGVEWFDGSEKGWKHIIGADSQFQTLTGSNLECICMDDIPGGVVDCVPIMGNPACWEVVTWTWNEPLGDASDGVVPLNKQELPGEEYKAHIMGSNHFQVRNHPDTRKALNKIFDAPEGIPTVFRVPKRTGQIPAKCNDY